MNNEMEIPHDTRQFRRSAGFTLIEMMVVVLIVGIVAGLSIPTWNKFTAKMKVSGAVRDMRSAIFVARSDAITRKRYSGILLDFSNRRYERFVDSSATASTTNDCHYQAGEKILQAWTSMPPQVVFYDAASSLSGKPALHNCDASAGALSDTAQVGTYALVFMPDGRSCATLSAKMGLAAMPKDTLRLTVFPATGLVTLE